MKFSTAIGAIFGNKVQCKSPAVVWMMAVGSAAGAAADAAGLWAGGVVLGGGVEVDCAPPSATAEITRTSVYSTVRMDAPLSCFSQSLIVRQSTLHVSVECGPSPPAAITAAWAQDSNFESRGGLSDADCS